MHRRDDPARGRGAGAAVAIRVARTAELSPRDLAALRVLFDAAWPDGGFSDDDLDHALGGTHWLAEVGDAIVGHAAVVERVLEADGHPIRTGYLEAAATLAGFERRGIGSGLVGAASTHIRDVFELGALSTGSPAFYERLGWLRWRGPTFVRTPGGLVRTKDEDDGILVLLTPRTPRLSPAASLSCDWRPGDAW